MLNEYTRKDWGDAVQIEGTDDGYTTLSGTTEAYSDNVNMADQGYEACQVTVEIDYDTAPTDEVSIKLYGSLDGVIYDNMPMWTVQGDKSVDPTRMSFVIEDLAHFRLGFVQAGSTDSHNIRAYYRPWRYTRH